MEEKNEFKVIKRNQYIIMVLIAIVIVILILTGSGSNKNSSSFSETNENSQTQENTNNETNPEYDVSKFKEVSGTKLESLSKSSTKIVYIGRSTCGYCTMMIPVLKQAQEKYDYQTLYVDIAKIIDFTSSEFKILDQNSYNSILNLKTTSEYDGYLEENFGATPMILILKKGKVTAIQTGYVEFETFEKFLNENGIK